MIKYISHYKLLKQYLFFSFFTLFFALYFKPILSHNFFSQGHLRTVSMYRRLCPGHVRRRKCTWNTVCMESLLKTCMTCRNEVSAILGVQILSGKFRVEFHFGRSVYMCVVSVQCVCVLFVLCVCVCHMLTSTASVILVVCVVVSRKGWLRIFYQA